MFEGRVDGGLFSPNTPGKHDFYIGIHGKIELKLGSTELTNAENGAFHDLFYLFVALTSVSADFFLYRLQQFFVLYNNIIFNLP